MLTILIISCIIISLLVYTIYYMLKNDKQYIDVNRSFEAISETLKQKKIDKVSIYCAHYFSEKLIPILKDNNIKIDNIFDRSALRKDLFFLDYKVKAPSAIKELKDDIVIIVAHFKHLREFKETIEYFYSKNKNNIHIKIIDHEGNITHIPNNTSNTLTIKISDKLEEKEIESIYMDKAWSLDKFAEYYFNTRGYKRKNPKIKNGTILNLESFEILKFQKAQIFSQGGVFVNKKIQKESLPFYYIDSSLEEFTIDKNLYNRYNIKQFVLNVINFFYFLKIRYKKKVVFCCPWTHNKNFGHFVTESYPRLYNALIELKKNKEKDFYIICPSKDTKIYNSYINPILESINIDESMRIYPNFGYDKESDDRWFVKKFFSNEYFFNFNNILLPTSISLNPTYCIPAFEHLKKHFFDESFCWKHKKIYISRKNANWRKLTNENELENLLEKKYGFKSIAIEEYSLKETINILMRTEVVVAPEGAVHGNMIFLPKNAKMIGLRAKDFQEYGIFCSSMIGYEQLFIVCDIAKPIEEGYELNSGFWYASDICVDLEYFEKKLADYDVLPI